MEDGIIDWNIGSSDDSSEEFGCEGEAAKVKGRNTCFRTQTDEGWVGAKRTSSKTDSRIFDGVEESELGEGGGLNHKLGNHNQIWIGQEFVIRGWRVLRLHPVLG